MSASSQEAKFELEELFFSITKANSTILSGNETFMRISGYERNEIVGKPHNIVRHGDMPRAVFKIFWEFLKEGKSVAAYVKNKTKEGGYYWVFAVVFPLEDRYVSIRIKPNAKIFPSVKELYARLIEAQEQSDILETQTLLLESLSALGYRDYEHFMNDALVAELLTRKRLLLETPTHKETVCAEQNQKLKIRELYCLSEAMMKRYEKWLAEIGEFGKIKSVFEEKSFTLSSLARDIVFLSINASVASYRSEGLSETFGVLSSDIRLNAKENDGIISQIYALSQSLAISLEQNIFLVSSIGLQMETVTYFIKELFEKNTAELTQNVLFLFELVHLYNKKLEASVSGIEGTIKKSIFLMDRLQKQIMYLDYIQIYGVIESSRDGDGSLGFTNIFLQLKSHIQSTAKEVSDMKDMAEKLFSNNKMLMAQSKENDKMLIGLKSEITNI